IGEDWVGTLMGPGERRNCNPDWYCRVGLSTAWRVQRNHELRLAGYTETVIRILKFRWDAGARCAARHLDVVTPGASTRSAALSRCRPLRIAIGRDLVIIRRIPVAAPFMHIFADVVQSEWVGRATADGLGAILPAPLVVRQSVRRFIPPGKQQSLSTCTCRAFPFRFSGKRIIVTGHSCEPLAVLEGIKPRHTYNRLSRIAEVRITPEGWGRRTGRGKELRLLGIAYLTHGKSERIDENALYRTLIVLSGLRAHHVRACWNSHQRR